MSAAEYDIIIDQGADYPLRLVIKEDGVPRDLSGYLVRGQLREKFSTPDSAPDAVFNCNIVNPTGGEILVSLSNAVTKQLTAKFYRYDLELYSLDTAGQDDFVTRILQGRALVSPEITR